MQGATEEKSVTDRINQRANILLSEQQQSVYRHTDQVFCWLLPIEWLAGILVAVWVSPLMWAGRYSDTHIHVWTAIFLGGLITLPPALIAIKQPGATLTRYLIATAQMLYGALLIHLTGGRIETHFYIFGSLAFLSFYRDWRLLIPASIVVAVDHILRGLYFPQSVYGSSAIEPYRWLEHAWWVAFEDFFLICMCLRNVREMSLTAHRQAEIEVINANIENLVRIRTEELDYSKDWATLQYKVVEALTEADSWHAALQQILESIISTAAKDQGHTWGAFWSINGESEALSCTEQLQVPAGSLEDFAKASNNLCFNFGCGLPGTVWQTLTATVFVFTPDLTNFPRLPAAMKCGLASGVVFPVWSKDRFFGVIELITEIDAHWNLDTLEALGRQIGQFASRKETESERERLANVVEQSSNAILTASANSLITSWNKGAEIMFGFKASEVVGKHISQLFDVNKYPDLLRLLRSTMSAGDRIDGYETTFLSKHEQSIDVMLFAFPFFNNSRDPAGYSLTLHNISERKAAERRVNEFYSIVSHELRTPLTSIRGVLGLIESRTVEPDSEEATELIGVARSSSDRLIRLINDMLDLKKIEVGKMELNKQSVETKQLVSYSLSALSGMAAEAGVNLDSEYASAEFVYADWDKAVQIISNLVSNAIKFSPPQGLVRVITEASGKERIRFRVLDNGPGIAPHDLCRLFDKFQQLDSSDTRRVGGTGLGLAISKALVEAHGGSIGLTSTVNVGTEFWFELPVYAEASERQLEEGSDGENLTEAGRASTKIEQVVKSSSSSAQIKRAGSLSERLPANIRHRKVLLVDDDEESRLVLGTQLRGEGLECLEASNGREALELVGLNKLDLLIILDILMPELDGFGVVQALKKDDSTSKLPLIVYSCKDLSTAERKQLVLGKTRFLLKGEASQADLIDTIDELLQASSPPMIDAPIPV